MLPFTDPERSEGDWDGEGGALSATQGVWFPSTGERSEPGISFLPFTLRTQDLLLPERMRRYMEPDWGAWCRANTGLGAFRRSIDPFRLFF